MTTCEINFRYHTVGIVLSQWHYFRARNYERYGTQIRYIILLSWKFLLYWLWGWTPWAGRGILGKAPGI